MELKDMILQTISDLENTPNTSPQPDIQEEQSVNETPMPTLTNDEVFLNALREKTLVLFEGLQSPQVKDIETKLDLVINYLQYQLCMIDERLKK